MLTRKNWVYGRIMAYFILTAAILFCAYRVMRAARLVNVTIWLAVTSALVAVLLYLLGAPEVAVIELSVGAGLVTVLFVYAFSITGDVTLDEKTIIPRPLVWVLVLAIVLVLSWLILPLKAESVLDMRAKLPQAIEPDFARMLWKQRGLDVLVQGILIFSGVMGLLGLLSTSKSGFQASQRNQADRTISESQPMNEPTDAETDVQLDELIL